MTAEDLMKGAVDLILPKYCAVCGRTLLSKERHLCLECAVNMPLTYFWTEKTNPMADRFNAGLADGQYSYSLALFFYKGKYRQLTKAVKYKGDLGLGRFLGEALGRKISSCGWMSDVDLIIPVPLHRLRKFVRGYNQAQVVAKAATSRMGAGASQGPVTDLLRRNRRTKSQAMLRGEQKATNVAGAFSANLEKLSSRPSHILLIDDVFTTGSTLAECHKALRCALVEKFGEEGRQTRISAAALAFVGD